VDATNGGICKARCSTSPSAPRWSVEFLLPRGGMTTSFENPDITGTTTSLLVALHHLPRMKGEDLFHRICASRCLLLLLIPHVMLMMATSSPVPFGEKLRQPHLIKTQGPLSGRG